jgi:hypothetical protein
LSKKSGLNRRDFIKTAGATIGGLALASNMSPTAASGTAAQPVPEAQPVLSVPALIDTNPIAGAFDMHVHTGPDITTRAMDAFQLTDAARSCGMRGLLLIHHQQPTVDRAHLARKMYSGIEVFGGIALNYPSGGLNLAHVDNAIKTGSYMVSVKMPSQNSGLDIAVKAGKPPAYGEGPGLWAIDKNGALVPELGPILKSIAGADLILLTGHLAGKEDLVLVKAAKAAGVKRIIITHAKSPTENLPVDIQKQLADMGAFIEHIALNYFNKDVTIEAFVADIKAVGAQRCIISTDLGQNLNPVPPEGLKEFVNQLMAKGITKAEMDLMIRKNPAMLLGLEPLVVPAG